LPADRSLSSTELLSTRVQTKGSEMLLGARLERVKSRENSGSDFAPSWREKGERMSLKAVYGREAMH
jgi:hypothetical protein